MRISTFSSPQRIRLVKQTQQQISIGIFKNLIPICQIGEKDGKLFTLRGAEIDLEKLDNRIEHVVRLAKTRLDAAVIEVFYLFGFSSVTCLDGSRVKDSAVLANYLILARLQILLTYVLLGVNTQSFWNIRSFWRLGIRNGFSIDSHLTNIWSPTFFGGFSTARLALGLLVHGFSIWLPTPYEDAVYKADLLAYSNHRALLFQCKTGSDHDSRLRIVEEGDRLWNTMQHGSKNLDRVEGCVHTLVGATITPNKPRLFLERHDRDVNRALTNFFNDIASSK